jgi:hypothetical protein
MKNNDYLSKGGFGLLCALLLALGTTALWLMSLPAQAAPFELPPRPTAEPTLRPVTQSEPAYDAAIRLHVSSASAASFPTSLWTVVQWQDARGDWHTVEGWQGTLDAETGSQTWWVARSDQGKGPFRWLVYRTLGGKLLSTSESFHLPHSGKMIEIDVMIAL